MINGPAPKMHDSHVLFDHERHETGGPGMEGDTESSRDVGMSRTLWRLPSYAEWFTADTATAIGVALRSLAISLIGYSMSHSTIAAGWLGSASMIAQQSCGVFGGTFVDRHDRRTLIIINAIVSLLCWGTVTGLLISNALTYWVLLLLAILSSVVNGFLGSASDAMLKSIINASDYPKARSLNEGRDAAVNMSGSPLGGFLYGVKPWLPFLVTSCMYAIAGVAATRIRKTPTDQPAKTQTDQQNQQIERQSFLTEFKEGWAWSFHRKMLVVVMVISALLNFGINGIQYGIQLHLVSMGVNGAHIGFVNTGIFCAMLVGAFVSNRLSNRLPVGPVVCASLLFSCLMATPMVFSDNYWIILVFNSLSGLPFPIVNAMLMGFVFAKTPNNMQGRITVTQTVPASVLSVFCSAAAGSLLPVCGFRNTMLVFLVFMLVSTAIALLFRPLRTIPRSSEWEHTPLY